jgi:hypothetical protein
MASLYTFANNMQTICITCAGIRAATPPKKHSAAFCVSHGWQGAHSVRAAAGPDVSGPALPFPAITDSVLRGGVPLTAPASSRTG